MTSIRAIILSGLLFAAGLAVLVPAAAHQGPTSCGDDDPHYWECTFICHAGDRIRVHAVTTGPNPSQEWPRVRAICGGVDFYCQSNMRCEGISAEVRYDDVGRCFAETVYADGGCESTPSGTGFPQRGHGSVGVASTSTPEVESASIVMPGRPRICQLGGILCIGPIQDTPVLTTPGVDAMRITPDVLIAYERHVEAPRLTTQTIGPIDATGDPVPITVCDTPCVLPSGVDGGSAQAGVVVSADGEVLLDRSLTLP